MTDVIIIGAGASGLMCACTLKKNNKNINVLLLEKNDKVGKKLALTGNGRCNLGNVNKDISNYHSDSDLSGFKNTLETGIYLDYLKEFGIYIKEENGLLYPNSNQALGVVKALERYFINNDGIIKYGYNVNNIEKKDDYYLINNDLKCKNLIMATGGLSYPKTGSTGDGYKLLKDYHNVTKLSPSLVPLISNYKYLKDISGVRFDCKVNLLINDELIDSEKGQVQFTDYGVSGICIFNLSRYIDNFNNVSISIDLIDELDDINEYISMFNNYKIEDALSNIINNKLAIAICKDLGISNKNVSEIDINNLINKLHNFKLNITGRKDYDSAQITKGGFILDDFNNNLESKKCKGLYVVGEALDVDAKCGGYNLSWAFTSALLASNYIISKRNGS